MIKLVVPKTDDLKRLAIIFIVKFTIHAIFKYIVLIARRKN